MSAAPQSLYLSLRQVWGRLGSSSLSTLSQPQALYVLHLDSFGVLFTPLEKLYGGILHVPYNLAIQSRHSNGFWYFHTVVQTLP